MPVQLFCETTALTKGGNWLQLKKKKEKYGIRSKKCFLKQDQFLNVRESDPTSSHADISDGRKELWGRGNTLSWLSIPVLRLMKPQPEEGQLCAAFLLPHSSFPPAHGPPSLPWLRPVWDVHFNLQCVYKRELEAVAVWDPPDLWTYSKLPVPGLPAL